MYDGRIGVARVIYGGTKVVVRFSLRKTNCTHMHAWWLVWRKWDKRRFIFLQCGIEPCVKKRRELCFAQHVRTRGRHVVVVHHVTCMAKFSPDYDHRVRTSWGAHTHTCTAAALKELHKKVFFTRMNWWLLVVGGCVVVAVLSALHMARR